MFNDVNPIGDMAGQSGPVDTAAPYSTESLRGKTIVITGGASGFGAAFSEKWAAAGAQIIFSDINDKAGLDVLATIKAASSADNQNHYYFHCDVTSWDSQVEFFRKAVEVSASGGIDAVVPNAGIAETQSPILGVGYEIPVADKKYTGPGVADPRKPQLAVVDVNITGVLYTVHLGLYWMAQNPVKKDRCILLISSIAGLVSLPGQALYTASKHAVTGLFRALRGTAGTVHDGLRVNMLCPYFVETGIFPPAGRAILAGGGKGRIEDVVDAATRLMSDHAIKGRALVIGPRILVGQNGAIRDDPTAADLVKEDVDLMGIPSQNSERSASGMPIGSYPRGQAVWECYANDLESSELFVWRFVRLLNVLAIYRGWRGVFGDMLSLFQVKPAAKTKAA